ncbi:mitochondrial amidoxime-reducing component 1 [Patella vulgata]|uniref:mitochondrial amidoxime-reducing component 1 n=1 Tax=Patella vulgata TaxID=6465 RepID=UPI0024A7B271|nr:mitochondrial amidoxime-reducing component 1 [Patella vulgata]
MGTLNDTGLHIFGYFLVSSSVKYIILRWLSKRKRDYELVGRVQKIYSYPIKSCMAMPLKSADCTKHGLKDEGVTDRHWICLHNGEILTLKAEPRLCLMNITIDKDDIIISVPNRENLRLPKLLPPTKENIIQANIYGELRDVVDCGESASKWISEFLDRSDIRIGFSPPDLPKRDMSQISRSWPYNGEEGDAAVFTYSTPYLLVSSSSLHEVNNGLDKPVPILRFRPNIVIDGTIPFDEDEWQYVKIGNDIQFRIVEPCRRCIITTIDPATGIKEKGFQPLKHLRSFRCIAPYGTSPLFGVYVALEKPGLIQIGQPVCALRK